MEPPGEGKDPSVTFYERIELLKHTLRNHEKQGGKVLLPIGMAEPENWLLEGVDVDKLLVALSSGVKQLELTKVLRNGPPQHKPGHKRSSSNVTAGLAEIAANSPVMEKRTPFTPTAPVAASPAAVEDDDTLLPLPQLQTGLSSDEMKDLAFLVFASVCPPQRGGLLQVTCSQLDISSERADHIVQSVRTVLGRTSRPTTPRASHGAPANGTPAASPPPPGPPATPGTPHPPVEDMSLASMTPYHYPATPPPPPSSKGAWQKSSAASGLQHPASLQLLAVMLEKAKRQDFDSFKGFVRWRRPVAHALVEGLQQAARESWAAPPNAPGAKALIARLKGAVRRLDVTELEDYDEAEYLEAATAVSETAAAISGCVRDGWKFPWSLRVRIAELLLRCLFDTLEEGAYIEEHAELLQVLRQQVWPLLGVTPLMDAACNTWAHFSQFLQQPGDEELLGRLQQHIQDLASLARGGGRRTSKGGGEDEQLAAQVGEKIVEWTAGKLADYHANFAGGDGMRGCLDLLRFAIHSQGGGDAVVGQKLSQLVVSSVSAELKRRSAALPAPGGPEHLLGLSRVTAVLMDDESSTFSVPLEACLRGAYALAALRLHAIYSHFLIPFLDQVEVLEDEELECIQTSDRLEGLLSGPVEAALQDDVDPEVMRQLRTFQPWGIDTHLQKSLSLWVSTQGELLDTCLRRNLQAETWKPLGESSGHSASSRDVAEMVLACVDTLFNFNIPLSPAVLNMLVETLDNVLQRYAQAVEQSLGSIGRLIPPAPTLTRFKQQEASKQEHAETGGPVKKGIFAGLSGLGATSYPTFLESVPKIDNSLASLTTESIISRAASVHFLKEHATRMGEHITERYSESKISRAARRTTQLLDEPLESAAVRLQKALEFALRFLATKFIFWDGRMDWLERLYRHRVANCQVTLSTLRGSLASHLESVAPLLPAVHEYATILLSTCVQAIERVLLDGGPAHLYIPEDVPLIASDLRSLRTLFEEGLEPADVTVAMQPLQDILTAMNLPSGPLLGDLQRMKLAGNREREMFLLKVAAHRADRIASKHLKETYNLSKRLK